VTGEINLGTEEETSVLRLVEVMGAFEEPDFSPEFRDARLGELDRSCLDASRAREALGWQAVTRIDEGLRLTYDWASTP
jgi:UDP-glucose 4-epimerase